MREVLGEEAFARWQLSRELGENPRPLADTERAVLRRAVAPFLAVEGGRGLRCEGARRRAGGLRQDQWGVVGTRA